MTRSRVALTLLMTVYVLSLLAVGQADDHRKNRVSKATVERTAAPIGEGSSTDARRVDSFTYYGPDDVEVLAHYPGESLYETTDYAETAEQLLAAPSDEQLAAETIEPQPVSAADAIVVMDEPEFIRDPQANENVAPLPPADIAATKMDRHQAAQAAGLELADELDYDEFVRALDEQGLEFAAAPAIVTQPGDMNLSVDNVLFDNLGQATDADDVFYARQELLAPSPATPVDACPQFHGNWGGIRCPLIDHCRDLMKQWRPEDRAVESLSRELAAPEITALPSQTPVEMAEDALEASAYGPTFDDTPVAPAIKAQESLLHPDIYGLDCDHYLDTAEYACPTQRQSLKPYYGDDWGCEDYISFSYCGRESTICRDNALTSADEYLDDESMWDCNLADPTFVPSKTEPRVANQAVSEKVTADKKSSEKPAAKVSTPAKTTNDTKAKPAAKTPPVITSTTAPAIKKPAAASPPAKSTPATNPTPATTVKKQPKKNEPTLAPPKPKLEASSMFLRKNGNLRELWAVSLADLLRDDSYALGNETAWFINVENDGLTRTARVDRTLAARQIVDLAATWLQPIATWLGGSFQQARGQYFADYGYSWDDESYSPRSFHRDLNLELEF